MNRDQAEHMHTERYQAQLAAFHNLRAQLWTHTKPDAEQPWPAEKQTEVETLLKELQQKLKLTTVPIHIQPATQLHGFMPELQGLSREDRLGLECTCKHVLASHAQYSTGEAFCKLCAGTKTPCNGFQLKPQRLSH